MSFPIKNLKWLVLSLVVLLLDQLTKFWVTQHLAPGEVFAVLPFFNLSLSFNAGAAFSFLAEAGGWQLIFFSVISISAIVALSIWLLKLPQSAATQATALALIIGGAAGNLVDRLRFGYVTDFLDFYYQHWHFATFNVADSAICVGATVLVLGNFLSSKLR